jgi:hypothetical protein
MRKVGHGSLALLLFCCGGRERHVDAVESLPTLSAAEASAGLAAGGEASAMAAALPGSTTGTAAERNEAAASCVERFPLTGPLNVGLPQTNGAVPGRPGVPLPKPTLDPILADCSAHGGSNCDARGFLSNDAAVCVARDMAPKPALAANVFWKASLGFNLESRRIEWSVAALICCGEAWDFEVDASSGAAKFSHRDAPKPCTSFCQEQAPAPPPAGAKTD